MIHSLPGAMYLKGVPFAYGIEIAVNDLPSGYVLYDAHLFPFAMASHSSMRSEASP